MVYKKSEKLKGKIKNEKKALITGVTGMVGSHMCDFLIKENQLANLWNL